VPANAARLQGWLCSFGLVDHASALQWGKVSKDFHIDCHLT